jgi:FADH2 O2-dependent halogenase
MDIFHYPALREVGVAGWPKQHFWYGWHEPDKSMDERAQMMFETLPRPIGPDVHICRADADTYLVSLLPKYGVDYMDETNFKEIEVGDRDIRVSLEQDGEEKSVRVRLIIDASGHNSALAKQYGLRDAEPNLRTNTRVIFGHFERVRQLDDTLGRCAEYRCRRDAGTVHHCFEGGWFWVIPFDNGITSIGLTLDRSRYPLDTSITAEEELRSFIERFPTVKAQLGDIKAVRPLARTDRVQFTSSQIIGDGFILTPHAASFVDALLSTGFLMTIAFVTRVVPAAKKALSQPDYSPKNTRQLFGSLERAFFKEVNVVDLTVSGMLESFRSFETFKQFWPRGSTHNTSSIRLVCLPIPAILRGCRWSTAAPVGSGKTRSRR